MQLVLRKELEKLSFSQNKLEEAVNKIKLLKDKEMNRMEIGNLWNLLTICKIIDCLNDVGMIIFCIVCYPIDI